VGYAASADLRLGRGRELHLGGRAFDLVTAIEDWQLRPDEVGFATLLWHRDYRDYYLSRGLSGLVRLQPAPEITLSGEITRTDATSIAARDPWTPFRNAEPWRPNPAVDEGRFTHLTASLDLGTRPVSRWTTGIRLHAEWERGRSDSLAPRTLPAGVRDPLPLAGYTYDRLFGDLRLHQPMGFGGLHLRAVGGTSIGPNPLPIQRRFSLGGPDPMPGYRFREVACNGTLLDPALPALCDRLVLFQAEFHGGIDFDPFDWDWDHRAIPDARRESSPPEALFDDWWWDGPQFVLFADAGAAWLSRDGWPGRLLWDVGAGLEFGSAAVYVARAIREDEPVRILLRLHRRF
jgi:hypothetical protein